MQQPVLTQTQQRRLVKLAREAGRTPQSMLRFVLRDGFEQCEDDVQAARMAEEEITRSGTAHGPRTLKHWNTLAAMMSKRPG